MNSVEEIIKKFFFNILSFKQYLSLLSSVYFILYNLGILKCWSQFKYHYFLKSVINKDDVVIDIGANLGYFSKPISKWVGLNGKVYCVEPVKPVRQVLERNVRNLKNVQLIPYALGTEEKEIRLGNDTRRSKGFIATGAHAVLEDKTIATDEFGAEMKKGSELFGDLERLDFIKCDVEGYETVIIPELEKILVKHQPAMLIETRKEKRKFILEFLSGIGYEGFILEKSKLFPVNELVSKAEDDILFVHQEKLGLLNSFFA